MESSAAKELANHTPNTPSAYHTFTYRGKSYLFDVKTGISLRIDEAAHEVLRLLLDHPKEKVEKLLKTRFTKKALDEVFLGIDYLRHSGLFKLEKEETPEQIDAYIRRVMRRKSPSIQLAVVQGCNMSCAYCYERGKFANEEPILMSKEVGERAVEFLIDKSQGCKELNITFFGGEPLLNWPLIKHLVGYAIKRAKETGLKNFFSLTTNAVLVTDEIARYIKKYNFGLMCSIDGPPEIQNKFRPLKGSKLSFYKAARGVKRIMKYRRQVTVRATTHKGNADWRKLHDFFERFGFSRFAIGSATCQTFKKGPLDFGPEDIEMLSRQVEDMIDFAFERLKAGKKLYQNPFAAIKDIHDRRHTGIRCGIGRGTSIVDVNGRIFPCHRYLGLENYCVGDIWSGYDEKRLYDYLADYYSVKKFCRACWLRNLCGGPCPWHVAHEDGHHRPPHKDFMCEIIKKASERSIWMYDVLKNEHPEYFKELVKPPEPCP